MDETTITIIGAGIVGLAIAAELAQTYENIVVVEKQDSFGRETSSRNSEVIHAGIYYPPGSLKANLCVAGAEQMYHLCECQAIPYKKSGKLIVASNPSEIPTLEAFLKTGKRNNVKNLVMLGKRDVMAKEPRVIAEAALYSPDTGIIDSHAVMKYYHNSAEAHGVLFSFNSEVNKLTKEHDGYILGIKQENYEFKSKIVINCAGLSSDSIADLAGIDVPRYGYTLKYCKGSYFSYAKPSPVNMLVYPVPHGALVGLGVHATLDLGGRLRFGPDAEYIDRVLDYKVTANKRESFYQGATKIISGLEQEDFIPDMSGIRPKLQGPSEAVRDFIIREESDKGLPGLINLIGIESPGLTAAPAIATMVAGMVKELAE